MTSPWHMPLPIGEFTTISVTLYFYSDEYSDKWVPLKSCCWEEATLIYERMLLDSQEILLFPIDLDPNSF